MDRSVLFLAPAASFALTNIMGGVGRDFHISESLVGLVSGLGVTLAGVFGSLIVPVLSRGVAPRPLYLLVGGAGALFSAALVLAPHIPATFALAVIGENIFQAASFSVQNLIILRTIGQNNPLAATQFGVLNAAGSLPLSYMQYADGQGYGVGGIAGAYIADASSISEQAAPASGAGADAGPAAPTHPHDLEPSALTRQSFSIPST